MTQKKCTKCKKVKPLEDFHRNKNHKDGRQYYCKDCIAEYLRSDRARTQQRKYKKSEQGRSMILRYHQTEEYKETVRMSRARYRVKYGDRIRARSIANNAVVAGRLLHPSECQCEHCENQSQEMHHEDYTKPLEVTYLCPKCHAELHPKS